MTAEAWARRATGGCPPQTRSIRMLLQTMARSRTTEVQMSGKRVAMATRLRPEWQPTPRIDFNGYRSPGKVICSHSIVAGGVPLTLQTTREHARDLVGFLQAQQAMVDEHAGERVADALVRQRRELRERHRSCDQYRRPATSCSGPGRTSGPRGPRPARPAARHPWSTASPLCAAAGGFWPLKLPAAGRCSTLMLAAAGLLV